MLYGWHYIMMEFHYRMCYVWNLPYHRGKWEYHAKKCHDIKGIDFKNCV